MEFDCRADWTAREAREAEAVEGERMAKGHWEGGVGGAGVVVGGVFVTAEKGQAGGGVGSLEEGGEGGGTGE